MMKNNNKKKEVDKKFKERRKYPRVPLTTQIKFRKIKVERKFIRLKEVETNISGGGILIPTKNLYPPGTFLELSFTIPSRERPINVIGEVRWCSTKAKGMGIQFHKISEKDKQEIIMYAKRGSWEKAIDQEESKA